MRRKARRVTQADFRAAGRAFVSDVARDMASLERAEAHKEQCREHLRAMGFDIPDEGSLAARAKMTDINGSD